MRDVVIIGTDTDAGKTTFSLLFLAAFHNHYAYWKPVETGESDSLKVRSLVPAAKVFDPVARFTDAVAPALAARRTGQSMPDVHAIMSSIPECDRPLIIETFGSPFSPWDDDHLQLELLKRLNKPLWLVGSSRVGAVGRMLSCLQALRSNGLEANAIILMGPVDPYAESQIRKHWPGIPVVSIEEPCEWTVNGIRDASERQRPSLKSLLMLEEHPAPSKSEHLIQRDRNSVWHPYTSLSDPIDPLPVVAAEKEFLILEGGRRIIDAISSWWTILHGHRYPPLMQSLREATTRLDHVLFAGVTHPDAVELAELILRNSPCPNGRVFFSDNGSTAVEVALKMAYQYHCHCGDTARTLFIGFENGYHGDTFGAMAIGRDPVFFGRFEPFLFRAVQLPVSPDRLDEFLKTHAHEVAAVIIEPLVQGAGGMVMHSPEALKAICEVARRHGVLFIADEVMTANRTGTIWACEQAGIAPDLITSGKTLTGGVMPLAATIVSEPIVKSFLTPDRTKTFFHGHSFTAHPLACAVAVANMREIETGHSKADAKRIEECWKNQLLSLRGQSGVRDVRICGTIGAVELELGGGYLSEVGPVIRQKAIEMGVLLRPLGNVLYAMPPLCTSNESLELIASAIRTIVQSVNRRP